MLRPAAATGREFGERDLATSNIKPDLRYKRDVDLYIIRIDTEIFEIPEAVVFGG